MRKYLDSEKSKAKLIALGIVASADPTNPDVKAENVNGKEDKFFINPPKPKFEFLPEEFNQIKPRNDILSFSNSEKGYDEFPYTCKSLHEQINLSELEKLTKKRDQLTVKFIIENGGGIVGRTFWDMFVPNYFLETEHKGSSRFGQRYLAHGVDVSMVGERTGTDMLVTYNGDVRITRIPLEQHLGDIEYPEIQMRGSYSVPIVKSKF